MLTDQTAIVTGASRGIGRAIAEALAERGAKVAVLYAGNDAAAQETVASIEQKGGLAQAFRCNVADFEEAGKTVAAVAEAFGPADILVNNAGIVRDSLVYSMKEEDFDAVVSVNLKGTFHMIKHCYPAFVKKRSGKIINISSVAGVMGNAGQANYAASKAGIIGLTKSVARELAGRSVNCNAIAPGFVETDMTGGFSDRVREAALAQIPMKRMGKPEDIAAMAAFLADTTGDYITGQVFVVDGGLCI